MRTHVRSCRGILPLLFLVLILGSCSKGGGRAVVDDGEEQNAPPPSDVGDLRITAVSPTTISLSWSAPHGGNPSLVAFEYDIRYAKSTIREENWGLANQAAGEPVPQWPGTQQVMLIDRLDPASTYSVAMKTRNSEGTSSHLSNVAAASLPPEAVVSFPDSALNARIREVIQKPSGDIHTSDLANLLELEGNDRGIVDLTGLQACTGLQILHVMSNRISDLTPLAGLIQLRILGLNANQVIDVAPIQNLVNLTQLSLGSNQITDLWGLRNMTKVVTLDLSVNQVSDIGHLGRMLELTALQLQGNQIGGILPLGGMTKLQYVQLDYNQIGSLLPLLENTGLGQGDEVFVRGNPFLQEVYDEQIPALTARGVTVHY